MSGSGARSGRTIATGETPGITSATIRPVRAPNETNNERLFPGQPNASPYVKDGINNCIVQGKQGAVNPGKHGTKVAAHYRLRVAPRRSAAVRLRLTRQAEAAKGGTSKTIGSGFGAEFAKILTTRLEEADDFYRPVTPPSVSGAPTTRLARGMGKR